jgi:hypothetical protein
MSIFACHSKDDIPKNQMQIIVNKLEKFANVETMKLANKEMKSG